MKFVSNIFIPRGTDSPDCQKELSNSAVSGNLLHPGKFKKKNEDYHSVIINFYKKLSQKL